MNGPHLVYFADPMCSWCWGFSPVIDAIAERFGPALPIRLIMGGLRPGTTKPLDDASKREIRSHWEHVHEASGQPFDFSFFDRQDFIYDTEPAAKAIVAMRHSGMEEALAYLKRIQAAFYAHNQDVTDEEVLTDLACANGAGRAAFLTAFRDDRTKQETWQDFAIAQSAGIRGFPSLIAGTGEGSEYKVVTLGYQPAHRILPPLEQWVELQAAHPGRSDEQT